jgi:hypothetical protein
MYKKILYLKEDYLNLNFKKINQIIKNIRLIIFSFYEQKFIDEISFCLFSRDRANQQLALKYFDWISSEKIKIKIYNKCCNYFSRYIKEYNFFLKNVVAELNEASIKEIFLSEIEKVKGEFYFYRLLLFLKNNPENKHIFEKARENLIFEIKRFSRLFADNHSNLFDPKHPTYLYAIDLLKNIMFLPEQYRAELYFNADYLIEDILSAVHKSPIALFSRKIVVMPNMSMSRENGDIIELILSRFSEYSELRENYLNELVALIEKLNYLKDKKVKVF